VFRAEPHDTARHLAEYVSLDAELGFIADHRDVLAVLRHALAGMTAALRSSAQPAARLLGVTIPEVPAEIPVVRFRDALAIAGAPPDEPDLAPAHERALGLCAAEAHGSEFIAVEGYPMSKRPFYTHPQPGDERWSNSFDLLFRGQELVTGGQRLHRHSDYLAAIRARGEDPAAYADYLEAFAHGMPPHGGFAIGLERWTGRLTRAENIRGYAVSAGPAPPDAVTAGAGSRVDAEASGYLVVPPVFKTGERRAAALAGSIPVRLRDTSLRDTSLRDASGRERSAGRYGRGLRNRSDAMAPRPRPGRRPRATAPPRRAAPSSMDAPSMSFRAECRRGSGPDRRGWRGAWGWRGPHGKAGRTQVPPGPESVPSSERSVGSPSKTSARARPVTVSSACTAPLISPASRSHSWI
jgi:hypothetical protein